MYLYATHLPPSIAYVNSKSSILIANVDLRLYRSYNFLHFSLYSTFIVKTNPVLYWYLIKVNMLCLCQIISDLHLLYMYGVVEEPHC